MISIAIGIDPGLDGGVVAQSEGTIFLKEITPTIEIGKSDGGTRRDYPEEELRALLERASGMTNGHIPAGVRVRAFIEKQQSMPKQGVTSMFSTGTGYGLWRGLLTGMRIPWQLVGAQEWQKVMFSGLPKPEKKANGDSVKASLTLAPLICQRLWPGVDFRIRLETKMSKNPHNGICDAAVLCEFGRAHLMGAA